MKPPSGLALDRPPRVHPHPSIDARRAHAGRDRSTNHPVANPLIFHAPVGVTRMLEGLAADGKGAAIAPEALAGTSPYLNGHLNRIGGCELDLSKPPAPLPFELPSWLQPPRLGAAASV